MAHVALGEVEPKAEVLDLASNEAEHTADALCYGVSYYCHRSQICLPPTSSSHHRPLTAGLLDMEF